MSLNEKGFGLVETIAALGLAIIVITSLVSLSVFTLRSSTRGKLLLRGSKYANEQLELVRAHRDHMPWEAFVTDIINNGCDGARCNMSIDGSYNLTISPGQQTEDSGGVNELSYSFTVTDPVIESGDNSSVSVTDPVLRIEIETLWNVGDEVKSAYIYTDMSNWRTQ